MPYKENCKVEGELITRLKVARLYFSCHKTQREIAENIRCHYNTINNIIRICKSWASREAMRLLRTNEKITSEQLNLFEFLKSVSRKPKSNRRSLKADNEDFILEKHRKLHYGYKRLFKHLARIGYDTENIFTLGKIKGVYKRNKLRAKKIRTANGERRSFSSSSH